MLGKEEKKNLGRNVERKKDVRNDSDREWPNKEEVEEKGRAGTVERS